MSEKKRERLEVIYDMLCVIRDNNNSIKPTRLLYASNLSQKMFKTYILELVEKKLVLEVPIGKKKTYSLTDKGFEFIKEYKNMMEIIDSFGL